MIALLIAAIACLGLAAGMLVNVVVDRVARDQSPMGSRVDSRRGCTHRGTAISARHILTACVTSLVWVLLAWWSAEDADRRAMLPTLLVVAAACIALWQIDVAHHRLPNAIVYPLYPIVTLGIVVAGLSAGAWPLASILGSLALWTVVFGGLHAVTRGRGMGMGDVKFAPVLAATLGWYGWGASVLGLMATFVIGGALGVTLLVARHGSKGQSVAFGPFMIIGLAIGLLLGASAAQWYITAG